MEAEAQVDLNRESSRTASTTQRNSVLKTKKPKQNGKKAMYIKMDKERIKSVEVIFQNFFSKIYLYHLYLCFTIRVETGRCAFE